jgi:hypothetical protein
MPSVAVVLGVPGIPAWEQSRSSLARCCSHDVRDAFDQIQQQNTTGQLRSLEVLGAPCSSRFFEPRVQNTDSLQVIV